MFWNLRKALFDLGYTYRKAADEIGISERTLSSKIHGKTFFTLPEMRALQKLAGGPPLDELFAEK